MSKRYSLGNGWTRVKTRSGNRYFHKGKPTSGKKFSSAAKRIRNTRKKRAEKETEELRKKLKFKPLKKKPKKEKPQPKKQLKKQRPLEFCRVKDREAFYQRVLADRKDLYKKISEEDYAELRVIIDIAPVRKGKRTKHKHKKESQRGFRSFRSLKKLKNFLGLNYQYREDELKTPVDWTKRGVCQFEKRAYQSSVQLRGERVIGEKIWKRYAIKQP